jgi:soluble lytic murein transglycosylase-like protein
MYRTLVKTVAWQESCWRQFVRDPKGITFLESVTGDIGLMQVNRRVWRGFYNLPRLQWDIAYNAGAGAEILARLMRRCSGSAGSSAASVIARGSYSAYNGGPASCGRWLRPDSGPLATRIDAAFWMKYQAMERGEDVDVFACAAAWDRRRPTLAPVTRPATAILP